MKKTKPLKELKEVKAVVTPKPIELDLDLKNNNRHVIKLMQGYNYSLKCNIFDDNDALNVEGATVQVHFRKADDKYIIQSGNTSISGNTITTVLDKDFTRVYGSSKLQIVLSSGGKTFGSWVIDVIIKKSAIQEGDIKSEDKITILEDVAGAITKAQETKRDLDQSIEVGELENYVRTFNTFNEMKQASGTLKDGQVVKTKGYYADNDGGGTEYIYKSGEFSLWNSKNKSDIKNIINNTLNFDILPWEKASGITINKKYPVGDLARYGVVYNKLTNNTTAIQEAFDLLGGNNIPIIVSGVFEINTQIVLKDRKTHTYTVIGKNRILKDAITVKSQNVFVGENFATGKFTEVTLNMDTMFFDCGLSQKVTVFKGIMLYNSLINDSKFYYPYVFIEGSFSSNTRIKNIRVQNFKYAFLTSSASKSGLLGDIVKQYKTTSSAQQAQFIKNNLLVNPNTNTHIAKCNDSFMNDDCYLAGSQAGSELPTVFVVDDIDLDFTITNCWFEFCEYMIKPLLKADGDSKQCYGFVMYNCNIQFFYRFMYSNVNYTSFTLVNNYFSAISSEAMKSKFKNSPLADFHNKKCGVIIADNPTDGDKGIFTDIFISNTRINTSDYFIYIDCGSSSKTHAIKEYNTMIFAGAPSLVKNPIKYKYHATQKGGWKPFKKSYLQSLDKQIVNADYIDSTQYKPGNDKYDNVFMGQIVMKADGTTYIAVLKNDTNIEFKQITN